MNNIKKTFKYSIYIFLILFSLFILLTIHFEHMVLNDKNEIYENYSLDKEKEDVKNRITRYNKDVLIIVDDFNVYQENKVSFNDYDSHGEKVSKNFLEYYFKYAKENNGKSIELVLLSNIYQNYKTELKLHNVKDNDEKYTLKEDTLREINCLNLMKPMKYKENVQNEYIKDNIYFKQVTKTCHSLESYLKMIREFNPNSKIVLSMSFFKKGQYLYLKELGKNYNIQYVQAYFNKFDKAYHYFFYIYHYFFTNQIEPLYVTNTKYKPLLYDKQISIKDLNLKLEDKYYDENNYSTSYLTPILAYEYYLNDSKNIVKHK